MIIIQKKSTDSTKQSNSLNKYGMFFTSRKQNHKLQLNEQINNLKMYQFTSTSIV